MSLTEMAWKLLQPAINLGLSEVDFWNMSIAEIKRWVDGATWRLKTQAQFDYQLANLIGISTARMMSAEIQLPGIEEVYPNLFEQQEEEEPMVKQSDTMMVSQNRFLAFAQAHNARMQKGVDK